MLDVTAPRIDRSQACRIADALLAAPRTTRDPLVVAAYDALATQASRWFARITATSRPDPIRVVVTARPEPYATAAELRAGVLADGVVEIFPAHRDRDRRHPLLDSSVGGSFDRFRAVHDVVSHVWRGHDFDRHGELAAWLAEDRLYTGLARWALATELHAAHSVRWTTGSIADLKATLLPLDLLAASRDPVCGPGWV